jgi:hypothetical protein
MGLTRFYMPTFRPRNVCRAALVAVVALCAMTVVAAQSPSLAEIARKEQERRKTQKPASKTYTNKDLPESAQGRTPQPPAQSAAAETKSADKPVPGQDDEKDETWWKTRINQAREELRRNEVFAEALQTRINSLSADFVNRDDPAQRALIGEDRSKALAEIARVKAEIDRGKKQIDDIEEEARKAGVPPGWLR